MDKSLTLKKKNIYLHAEAACFQSPVKTVTPNFGINVPCFDNSIADSFFKIRLYPA